MSEGSLCPCTEPDDDHGSTATATRFWKGISTGRAEEASAPEERPGQSPAELTPLEFWVQPFHPQTPRAGFTSGQPPGLWRTEQLRANSRPKAPAPQKTGQWGKN